MMKIGVISDTHGYLDPVVRGIFKGVDHILHGGDIGMSKVISALEEMAPVTAVTGNTDAGIDFKETETVRLAGKKFLVHHIVDVNAPAEVIKRCINEEKPDVVVFGHTHRRFCEFVGPRLYLNPGYAGKPRFHLLRSVAIVSCDENRIEVQFVDL